MAEYTYNAVQVLQPQQAVVLNNSIPCTKGYVIHREDSGIFILRGIVHNNNGYFARYQLTFNANVAIPTGGTAQSIALALTVNGEEIPTSKAIVTPVRANEYGNATVTAIVTVPRGCCLTVAIKNVAATDGATEIPINVQNANLVINRIA